MLDEEEHKKSSSGGLGHFFATKFIEMGGVVYGCSSWIKDGKEICHVRCDCYEDIEQLRGSKYVHSFINDMYKQVKKDLTDNRQVLFVGTPCQIAGLKAYLTKEQPNLFTVDLICHGVPPQKLFFEHLNDLQMEDAQQVSFRDNLSYNLFLQSKNKSIKIAEWNDTY